MFRQILTLLSIVALSGCHYLYEQPITQGTHFNQSQREQIKIGMTRSDVIKTMGGTPVLSTVNPNQLIYIATDRKAHSATQINKLTITFKDNKVTKVQ